MPLALRSLYKVVLVALAAGCLLVVMAGRAEAETTLASWYGPGFEGLPTASGETYDPYGYTAAHKTLPFGTQLTVSYGGSSVGVTVNDRGPYVAGRELDLSQGAAEAIGLTNVGVDYVDYSHSGIASDQYAADTTVYEDQYAGAAAYQYESPDPAPAAEVYEESGVAGDGGGVNSRAVWVEPQQPPASDLSGELHVVRPGDTLSGISVQLGVSVETLAADNGISDPNFILAGQILYY